MYAALAGAVLVGVALGLLGSGGSILLVPVLVYLVQQPPKVAIAGSLAVVTAVSLASAAPYILRRQVSWRSLALFAPPGMAGTYAGAWLGGWVSGTVQLGVLALVMGLAAYFMLRPQRVPAIPPPPCAAWKVVADGLAVGVLTGFVGVGGGFLIVPVLVLLGGIELRSAIGTSLLVIALKSASGFYKYLDVLDERGLALDWGVIAQFSMLGIAGALAAATLGGRLPQDLLRRIFGGFLIVLALVLLTVRPPA
jgi:uncharacterized protein